MLKPLVSSVIEHPISTVSGTTSSSFGRHFFRGDSIVQSYAEVSKPIVLSGDFTISFDAMSETGVNDALIGAGRTSGSVFVGFTAGNEFKVRLAQGQDLEVIPSAVVADLTGKMFSVTIERTGLEISVKVGSYESVTETPYLYDVVIGSVGAYSSTPYILDGFVSNLYIEDKTDSLITKFALDKQPMKSQYKYGAKLSIGAPPVVSNGVSWTVEGDNATLEVVGAAGGYPNASITNHIPNGVFRLTGSMKTLSGSGRGFVSIANVGISALRVYGETTEEVFFDVVVDSKGNDKLKFYWDSSTPEIGDIMEFKDISVREITNYEELEAFKIIEYAKGSTLSGEYVSNGKFSDGLDDWRANGDVTLEIADGVLHLDQTSTYTTVYQTVPVVIGEAYLFSGYLDPGTAQCYFQIRDGNSQYLMAKAGNRGKNYAVFLATTDTINLRCHGGITVGQGAFSDVSIQKLNGNALKYVNTSDDSFLNYELTKDGWLGDNLWNDKDVTVINSGTSTSTFDKRGGIAHISTGADQSYTVVMDESSILADHKYLISADLFDKNLIGGGLAVFGGSGGDGSSIIYLDEDSFKQVATSDRDDALFKRASGGGEQDFKMNNISVRHLVGVAGNE